MNINNNLLDINNYVLTSSTEVSDTVAKINYITDAKVLVHITSFIHNTVLVQNLKSEIQKLFPDAKIVFLKHEDRTNTNVDIFYLQKDIDVNDISDEILRELHLDSWNKNVSLQEYRNQLLNRYFTDHLTNLPNMYQLRKDLQNSEDSGLVLIKIDNFATVNNFYGFIVGDYVIEEVGKYLKESLVENKIYKLSGAEYAMTLDNNLEFYELKNYMEELYKKINSIYIKYQNIKIFINLTLASSVNTSSNLFSKVSMALKYAQEGGLPFWIYEDRMHFENEYERNLQLSAIVRDAIEKSNIIPYYQPILDNKTSEIVKYECLARLINENKEIISPMIFIPIAKKIKLYHSVTTMVINKSFETFENNDYEFNINLSIEDIMNGKIFNFIIDKLKNSKAASRVTFELLESEAIQDFKKVERFISEIKRYGAKIAIDDFGSGYSNFSYLTKMNPNYIKIDGSLIENIDTDKASLLVVESIVEFAKKLGVETIAEYVHSSVVLEKVKSLGINYSQGFYIDQPSIDIKKY